MIARPESRSLGMNPSASPPLSTSSRLEISTTASLRSVAEPLGQVAAVAVGKPDVDEDQVGTQLARRDQRLGAVGRLADDLEAVAFEHAPGAGPKAGVVVDDQDSLPHLSPIVAQRHGCANTGTRLPPVWLTAPRRHRRTPLAAPLRPRDCLPMTLEPEGGAMKPKGIAARAGRWSAEHRFKAISSGWSSSRWRFRRRRSRHRDAHPTRNTASASRSRPIRRLAQGFNDAADETVLIQGYDAESPEFRAAVDQLITELEATENVERSSAPTTSAGRSPRTARRPCSPTRFPSRLTTATRL